MTLEYEPHPVVDELLNLFEKVGPAATDFAIQELVRQRQDFILRFGISPPKPKQDPLSLVLEALAQQAKQGDEKKEIVLNEGQQSALEKITAWLASPLTEGTQFFALRGVAGSGKSLLMNRIRALPYNFHFSAPTNKAAKVLSEFLGEDVKTTYSLLGLRMTSNEDTMELTAGPMPDLGSSPVIVVDEAGMSPSIVCDLLASTGYRVLYVGDPYQLNPVGESASKAWKQAGTSKVTLTKVERFDNQLLALSIKIREQMQNRTFARNVVQADNDGVQGVFDSPFKERARLKKLTLDDWRTHKIVCWRNKTADAHTNTIREALGFTNRFEIGESLLLAAPLQIDGKILGYTDEELTVTAIEEKVHSFVEGTVSSFSLAVKEKDYLLQIPKNADKFQALLNIRAAKASKLTGKARKEAWSSFWELKNKFHSVRYGYALTSHRVQGSTYTSVTVDVADILANPNKREAFRALYVACTRPTTALHTV